MMMLVHIAYPISTIEISHQNSSLLLLPSLDWRFDYFYYRQRNRRSILIRHPSSRLIRLHYPCCALCTILLARYPGAVPFNLSILPLTFLFYFLLSIVCIRMESSPQKMADRAAQDGQAPSIFLFSLNVYTSEAFTSWTTY